MTFQALVLSLQLVALKILLFSLFSDKTKKKKGKSLIAFSCLINLCQLKCQNIFPSFLSLSLSLSFFYLLIPIISYHFNLFWQPTIPFNLSCFRAFEYERIRSQLSSLLSLSLLKKFCSLKAHQPAFTGEIENLPLAQIRVFHRLVRFFFLVQQGEFL